MIVRENGQFQTLFRESVELLNLRLKIFFRNSKISHFLGIKSEIHQCVPVPFGTRDPPPQLIWFDMGPPNSPNEQFSDEGKFNFPIRHLKSYSSKIQKFKSSKMFRFLSRPGKTSLVSKGSFGVECEFCDLVQVYFVTRYEIFFFCFLVDSYTMPRHFR